MPGISESLSALGGRLARRTARGLMRLYYPTIEISHRDRIPQSGPVLFVANHANSLLDPPVIGWVAQRPVQFFAKSSLFDMPVLGPIIHALGMIPAYRGTDDPSQVRRNLETLRAGAEHLVRGSAVGIFPEGKSHDLTRVEMIRSGAGRIALQAASRGTPVTVVPLGINYERKERFRSSVWVRVGRPIDAASILNEHVGNERKALRQFTELIEQRLKEVVVHLDEPQWQPFLHELESLLPPPQGEDRTPGAPLRQRKLIADAMNHWIRTDRPRAEAMAKLIEDHRTRLSAAGLSLESPIVRWKGASLGWRLLVEPLILLPLLLPSLAGLIHHWVPFALTQAVIRRQHHTGLTWLAVRTLMLSIPLYAGWYLLVGWAITTWFGFRTALSWSACMPAAGIIAWHHSRRLAATVRHWGQEIRMLFRPRILGELRQDQANLRRDLSLMAGDYRKLPHA